MKYAKLHIENGPFPRCPWVRSVFNMQCFNMQQINCRWIPCLHIIEPPPNSAVVNTQRQESGGSWIKTCSGVWYPSPRLRPCGVAITTLVDLVNWLENSYFFLILYIFYIFYLATHIGIFPSRWLWGRRLWGRRTIRPGTGIIVSWCWLADTLPLSPPLKTCSNPRLLIFPGMQN